MIVLMRQSRSFILATTKIIRCQTICLFIDGKKRRLQEILDGKNLFRLPRIGQTIGCKFNAKTLSPVIKIFMVFVSVMLNCTLRHEFLVQNIKVESVDYCYAGYFRGGIIFADFAVLVEPRKFHARENSYVV